MSGKDIFTAFRFAYCIDKTFGSINYTIEGVPNQRRIVITKYDNSLFVIRFFVLCYPFVAQYIIFKYYMSPEEIFQHRVIASYTICAWLQCLLIPYNVKLTLVNRKEICNIWVKLDKLFTSFKIHTLKDYIHIKKASVLVTIFSYIFIILFSIMAAIFVVIGSFVMGIFELISRNIFLFLGVAMDCELIHLLLLIKSITKILNRNFFLVSDIDVQRKKYLHVSLMMHYELFLLGSEVNKIFNFLWIKMMLTAGFFAIVVFYYCVSLNQGASLIVILSLVYNLSWGMAFFMPLLIIISLCETIKKEVSETLK